MAEVVDGVDGVVARRAQAGAVENSQLGRESLVDAGRADADVCGAGCAQGVRAGDAVQCGRVVVLVLERAGAERQQARVGLVLRADARRAGRAVRAGRAERAAAAAGGRVDGVCTVRAQAQRRQSRRVEAGQTPGRVARGAVRAARRAVRAPVLEEVLVALAYVRDVPVRSRARQTGREATARRARGRAGFCGIILY